VIHLIVMAAAAGIAVAGPLLLGGAAVATGAKVRRSVDLLQNGAVRPPSQEEIELLAKLGKDTDSDTLLVFFRDELVVPVTHDQIANALLDQLDQSTDPLTVATAMSLRAHVLPGLEGVQLPVGVAYDAAEPTESVLLTAYERGRESGPVLRALHGQQIR